jgi:hypothetical protein
MSANPRRVLADVWLQWGEPRNQPLLIRKGTILDVVPGGQHESALGGSSNLQVVSTDLGSADTLDKSFLSN